MSLVNTWIGIGIILMVSIAGFSASFYLMIRGWKEEISFLRESLKNADRHIVSQEEKLNRIITAWREAERKRDEAVEAYDKLSHSWPYSISDEEHQKLVDGFWKEEQK